MGGAATAGMVSDVGAGGIGGVAVDASSGAGNVPSRRRLSSNIEGRGRRAGFIKGSNCSLDTRELGFSNLGRLAHDDNGLRLGR